MSDFNTWIDSYNGDHQRAAKDAFDGMQAYIAGHRRMAEDRDALAAHVERLSEALHQALVHWGAHCPDEDGAAYAECEKRCDESPATSLAHLKPEWQAEVSWHEPTIQKVREMCDGLTGNQIRHALDGMLESTPPSQGE